MYVSGSVTIKVMVSSYTITSSDNNMAKLIMEDNIPYEKVHRKNTGHEFWEQDGLQIVWKIRKVQFHVSGHYLLFLSSKQLHMYLLSLLATRLLSRTYSVNFKVALTYSLISGERSA